MSVVKYKYGSGLIDVTGLISLGVSKAEILCCIENSIPLVKNLLVISCCRGLIYDECESILPFVNIASSAASKRALEIGNNWIDIRFMLNREMSEHIGAVEFVPLGAPLSDIRGRERFALPISSVFTEEAAKTSRETLKRFSKILFAGTFDHLHHGHKTILIKSLLMTTSTLYVAVTTQSLVSRKLCAEAIQPFEIRRERVREFIESIRPPCQSRVDVVILETSDGIAPADKLDFDALIVTSETIAGGILVNQVREKNGLHTVELVPADIIGGSFTEDKLSSTSIRKHICKSLPGGERDLKTLRGSWDHIITELKASSDTGSKWWCKLMDTYGLQPWRFYHNLLHINELLEIALFEYENNPPLDLLLAVWFHDSVYDPQSSTNESDSINLFRKFSHETGLSSTSYESVERAIALTRDHMQALNDDENSRSEWTSKFLEMDLAILGSNKERFERYKTDIRSEYQNIDDAEYSQGRVGFLEKYFSFEFSHLRESARLTYNSIRNLQGEIDFLKVK